MPEALYLTLRLIRYGCYHARGIEHDDNEAVGSIARQAGDLMRRRYSTNP